MKRRKMVTTGQIDSEGKLKIPMGEVNEFLKFWKNTSVIVTFDVYQSGTSEALKGYYYNYVVPTMKQAFYEQGERLTEQDTEKRLRQLSPVMWSENVINGGYEVELKSVEEISNAEFIEHIETIRQIAAEELNTIIEEPK